MKKSIARNSSIVNFIVQAPEAISEGVHLFVKRGSVREKSEKIARTFLKIARSLGSL